MTWDQLLSGIAGVLLAFLVVQALLHYAQRRAVDPDCPASWRALARIVPMGYYHHWRQLAIGGVIVILLTGLVLWFWSTSAEL